MFRRHDEFYGDAWAHSVVGHRRWTDADRQVSVLVRGLHQSREHESKEYVKLENHSLSLFTSNTFFAGQLVGDEKAGHSRIV